MITFSYAWVHQRRPLSLRLASSECRTKKLIFTHETLISKSSQKKMNMAPRVPYNN
jgi:hypothetical protein